ncbi:hypothetical protein GCM10027569_31150 [Flindersiella endophytica]
MPIRVDPVLRGQLQDNIDVTFVVRTQDLVALDAAMSAVVQAIWDLGPRPEEWPNSEETPSPSFISDPVRIPGGRLIHIDFHDLPAGYRIRLPDALTDVLAGHGIADALVEVPALLGDRYLNLDRFTPLVRTWLHDPRPEGAPRFTTRPSEALVEVALAWLRETRSLDSRVSRVSKGADVGGASEALLRGR